MDGTVFIGVLSFILSYYTYVVIVIIIIIIKSNSKKNNNEIQSKLEEYFHELMRVN